MCSAVAWALAAALSLPTWAGPDGGPPLAEAVAQTTPAADAGVTEEQTPVVLRNHIFWGHTNNHPRLKVAEKEIDARINRSLRAIAPGFDDVRTFSDQRDDFGIWTPFIGVGRNYGEKWDVFLQMGYTQGKIRTRATDATWLLLPLKSDVEFKRSSFYAGGGAAYYPWGLARPGEYHGVRERLQGARPFIGTSLNWNYLTFDGKVKARLAPLPFRAKIEDNRTWSSWGASVNLGVDIPMTKRSVAACNVQWSHMFKYGDDFNGPAFSMYWKRYF